MHIPGGQQQGRGEEAKTSRARERHEAYMAIGAINNRDRRRVRPAEHRRG